MSGKRNVWVCRGHELANALYNDVVQRIVRVSLNTLKEETLLEMLYMMPCGMDRMESMFAILDNFFFQ